MTGMMDRFGPERVSISLPSLRVGTLTPEMCRQISRVRKTGFTIAPEAGTQRLRDVINKNITEDGLVETAETVFHEGWDLIKLYFMTGLPTETDADLDGIINLSRKVLDAGKRAGGRRKMVNVGVSAFVPKPHTPFQWMGQIPMAEIRRRKDYLRRVLGKKPFALKSEHAETSVLEAAFARGGRKLGEALHNAWEAGARFDSWSEMFNWGLWVDAFKKAGLDIEIEAARDYRTDEVLPWDHIDSGVDKKFLLKELDKALSMEATPDCRVKCSACGLKCPVDKEKSDGPAKAFDPAAYKKEGPSAPNNMPSARVRLKYTKLSPLSLLSHNELMTVFFRTISRAGLPILFSEGFNPHPKLSFGPALAVGVESEAEILDMELSYGIDLSIVVKTLNRTLPSGIRITEGRILRNGEPAAGVGLTSFTYEAEAPDDFEGSLDSAVSAFLAADAAVVTRKSDKGTKELDIRPMVRDITVTGARTIRFTLQEAGGRSAKPHEVGQALFGMSPEGSRALKVKRTALN
jgi:radical SAM-linked protein